MGGIDRELIEVGATSSLDPETERVLQEALSEAMENRTSVVVAQRLSTVEDCDCIFVIRDGGVEESGSHQELIQRKGYYFHFLRGEKSLK